MSEEDFKSAVVGAIGRIREHGNPLLMLTPEEIEASRNSEAPEIVGSHRRPRMSEGALAYTGAIVSGASVEEARAIGRGEDLLAWYREQVAEMESDAEEYEAMQDKVWALESDLTDAKAELSEAEKEVAKLKEQVSALEREIEQQDTDIEHLIAVLAASAKGAA